MRSRLSMLCALCVLAVSVLAAAGARAAIPQCGDSAIAFSRPLRLGTGQGYEPGIDIDSTGTVFVTAHKLSLALEESRTASYLWRSRDAGHTFSDVVGENGTTKDNYALEGDLAIDAKDRLYMADTWAADNFFYRYSNHGTTLDFERPAVPSPEVDDRPWLAAHGDGYVYYMSNNGVGASKNPRLTVHRSEDGGQTFDPVGHKLMGSLWGFVDADPRSAYVYAAYNSTTRNEIYADVSPDRGVNWTRVKVADYFYGYDATANHEDAYPVVAVSPADGTVYVLFGDNGKRLKLARSTKHGAANSWTIYDVTPFSGTYSYPWLTVSRSGDVGITFEAFTKDAGSNHVYGMLWRPSAGCARGRVVCSGPASTFARLSPGSTGPYNLQADFFQDKFAPDGSLNTAFTGVNNEIFYVRQTKGPNLAGTRFCGRSGTP